MLKVVPKKFISVNTDNRSGNDKEYHMKDKQIDLSSQNYIIQNKYTEIEKANNITTMCYTLVNTAAVIDINNLTLKTAFDELYKLHIYAKDIMDNHLIEKLPNQ